MLPQFRAPCPQFVSATRQHLGVRALSRYLRVDVNLLQILIFFDAFADLQDFYKYVVHFFLEKVNGIRNKMLP